MHLLTLVFVATLGLGSACGGASDAGGPLPARCKGLRDGLAACADRLPADARPALLELLRREEQSWERAAQKGAAARDGLEAGCNDALSQVREAVRGACPDVVWP